MKHIYYTLLIILCFACNGENVNDCVQASGAEITREFEVTAFTEIETGEGVILVLKEGTTPKVVIESGENLFSDIEVRTIGNNLLIGDNNTCNYVRDFALTTAYITAPNITKIRHNSQYELRSEGTLTFPNLELISENFTDDVVASGEIYLNLKNESLKVTFNNLSNLFLTGSTDMFEIDFPGGNSRIEAENFLAKEIDVFTRGSNDIIVFPVERISGDLFGTGDLILKNTPQDIDVTAHYTGSVIVD